MRAATRTGPLLLVLLAACGTDEGACSPGASTEPHPGADVVINEVRAKSRDGTPDWIELTNRGESTVQLGCWSFVDQSDKHTPFFLSPGVELDPGDFLVVHRDKAGVTGFVWGFGASGDAARLRDDLGRLVDETTWSAGQAPAGSSWGRYPDGTGPFTTLLEPTEGASNSEADPDPPVIP